ncbi:ABC transporter permease [Amycolatopsis azurea]|uniref:ABC transporter permease n=1 Tax=Amycolatopsis azurea TaxID=36819 RepID=UPI0037F1425A
MTEFLTLLLGAAFIAAAPLIMAGIGEMVLERSGAGFNLGLDGIMVVGALAGVLGSAAAGPWVGLLTGFAAGVAGGLVYAVSVALGLDIVLTGIAISIVGAGLTTYAFEVIAPAGQTNISGPLLPTLPVPGLAELPVVGPPLRALSVGLWLAVAAAIAAAWALRSTRAGLRMRAAADHETAVQRGIAVGRYRMVAALIAGGLAGIAGAALTLTTIGTFTPLMTGGRGFLALAVVIIGRRTPSGVVAGAMLFAVMDGLGLLAQTRDLGLPTEAYHALPYLTALIVLCVHSARQARQDTRKISDCPTSARSPVTPGADVPPSDTHESRPQPEGAPHGRPNP